MWKTHRGDFLFVNDMYVANLRAPATTSSPETTFHLSVYDVTHCPSAGPGRVAYLRDKTSDDPRLSAGLTLTDAPELADFLRDRLRSANWRGVDIEAPPVLATFERSSITSTFEAKIAGPSYELTARWSQLSEPLWSDGVSPNYPYEHAWALVLTAGAMDVTLNDRVIDGALFPDERFKVMYGRALSSCNIGLAEVHLSGLR